jgi:hypothetical protein
MHPNTRFEAAHLATRCAPTLAHREILKASHTEKEERAKSSFCFRIVIKSY